MKIDDTQLNRQEIALLYKACSSSYKNLVELGVPKTEALNDSLNTLDLFTSNNLQPIKS